MLDRREVIEYYNARVQEIKYSGRREDRVEDREVFQLKHIRVEEGMRRDIESINTAMSLEKLGDFLSQQKFSSFPVVDALGQLNGILSLSDYQAALKRGDTSLLTAIDIATHNVVTVTQHDTLFSALTRITAPDFAILPVVDRNNPKKLLGVISRRDIMSALIDAIVQKRSV